MNFADRLNEAAKYGTKKDEAVFTESELREANNKIMGLLLRLDIPGIEGISKFEVIKILNQYVDLILMAMKGEMP